jgi:hypothetical protein
LTKACWNYSASNCNSICFISLSLECARKQVSPKKQGKFIQSVCEASCLCNGRQITSWGVGQMTSWIVDHSPNNELCNLVALLFRQCDALRLLFLQSRRLPHFLSQISDLRKDCQRTWLHESLAWLTKKACLNQGQGLHTIEIVKFLVTFFSKACSALSPMSPALPEASLLSVTFGDILFGGGARKQPLTTVNNNK